MVPGSCTESTDLRLGFFYNKSEPNSSQRLDSGIVAVYDILPVRSAWCSARVDASKVLAKLERSSEPPLPLLLPNF